MLAADLMQQQQSNTTLSFICSSVCVGWWGPQKIKWSRKWGWVAGKKEEWAASRGCWDRVRGLEVARNYSTTTPPTRVMAYTSPSRLSEVRGFVRYMWFVCESVCVWMCVCVRKKQSGGQCKVNCIYTVMWKGTFFSITRLLTEWNPICSIEDMRNEQGYERGKK